MARTWRRRELNGVPSMLRHPPAGFGDDQRPAGHVPRLQIAFPEAIHPAGRDVTQIDRRRPQPPHGPRLADERAEQADDFVDAAVHVVRKAGDDDGVDERRGARTRATAGRSGYAPPPRSAVNSSWRFGSNTAATSATPSISSARRGAEDRNAVRVVRRAVDRIEDPARSRRARRRCRPSPRRAPDDRESARRSSVAEHALDGDVDLGDEVDRAFLVDLEIAAELLHLQLAGADDRLDRRGEEQRVGATQAGRLVSVARAALDHPDFHAALGRAAKLHVVHEAADQEYAAAARLQQILRRQRIGHACPDRSPRPDRARGWSVRTLRRAFAAGKLDEDVLARVVAVAVLDRVDDALADRDADVVLGVIVQTRRVCPTWSLTTCTKSSISNVLVNSSRTTIVRSSHMPSSAAVIVAPARRVQGRLRVPGDKSISHRYALLAALAEGRSELTNFSPGADCRSTLSCLRRLGVEVTDTPNGATGTVTVMGRGVGCLSSPSETPRCRELGNHHAADGGRSSPDTRFRAGLSATRPFPAGRCAGSSSRSSAWAPASRPPTATRRSRSTAPRLQAIAHQPGRPERPGQERRAPGGAARRGDDERPSSRRPRATTPSGRSWRSAGTVSVDGLTVSVSGGQRLVGRKLSVPGDFSSAAFWLVAAAAIPGSRIEIENVGLNPTRTALLDVLRRFGARVDSRDVTTTDGGEPQGTVVGRTRPRPADRDPARRDPGPHRRAAGHCGAGGARRPRHGQRRRRIARQGKRSHRGAGRRFPRARPRRRRAARRLRGRGQPGRAGSSAERRRRRRARRPPHGHGLRHRGARRPTDRRRSTAPTPS